MEQSYALHCQAELGGQGRSQAQLGNEKKICLVPERMSIYQGAVARKAAFGNGVFGNMPSAMNRIFTGIWIISIGTR